MTEASPYNHEEEYWKNLAEDDTPVTNTDLYNFVRYSISVHDTDNFSTLIDGELPEFSRVKAYLYRELESETLSVDIVGRRRDGQGRREADETIQLRKSPTGAITTWWVSDNSVYSEILGAQVAEQAATPVDLKDDKRKLLFKSIHSLHTQTLQNIPQHSA